MADAQKHYTIICSGGDHERETKRYSYLPGANAPYDFSGQFFEACDCYTICPCWTGRAPDEGECTGLFAWSIESGYIDGIYVAGRQVVSGSQHSGHRDHGEQRVFLFVDDEATPKQREVLAAALTGRLGGPLSALAELLGELAGVQTAAITMRRKGRRAMLAVGKRVLAESSAKVGATGKITTLADAEMSVVLGSPAEVGVAGRFRIGIPETGIDLNLRGRSSMRGSFSYTNAS